MARTDPARAAFTLIEMTVATGLGCLILAALLWTSLFTSRGFAAVGNYRDLELKSRIALDKMSYDIRQANQLTNYTATSLIFSTTDPTTSNTYSLSYTYSTNALTLTRVYNGSTNIVLSNCTYFHFDLYQRNPTLTNGGNLESLISTNSASMVKAIDLTWICSQTMYDQTLNSDDVQSARVVIRKD
jgi:hypothetical protein